MKNTLRRRDLEELLSAVEPVEPPPGLEERLKADIPLNLPSVPLPPNVLGGATRFRRARPWLAVAASLSVAVTAAWLAYRSREVERPVPEPSLQASTAPAPAGAPPRSAGEAAPVVPDLGVARGPRDQALGVPAPAPPAPPARRAPTTAAAQPEEPVPALEASPPSPAYISDAGPSPAAAKRQERRRQLETNEVHDGAYDEAYVEGGVAGSVPGGVAGGAPGGIVGGVPSRLDTSSAVSAEELARLPTRRDAEVKSAVASPSTGGEREPNEQPYGDVFFRAAGENPFVDSEDDALSTFALDVDTGSYTVLRRYLRDGNLPPREAIRVEEMINYFHYGDAPPTAPGADFALYAEGAPSPFALGERYRLLRFAVKAREIAAADRKAALLIFVVDVSGSMDQGNRLDLVKQALALLVGELRADDRVGLVVYGSRGRVVLEPTGDKVAIRSAIASLHAEGSTNAEEGLQLAYELANRFFRPGAIHRLLLCSDGVANVGATGPETILARIAAEARKGIDLTTIGFGMGNYNDALMEQLADQGDGLYAYVDELAEARRVFVEGLTGTLQTIAGDAKVQVEFDPAVVARWRLVGYENRDIADRDFRNDQVDAGEVGAGHTVTALYEIKLHPAASRRSPAATLRLRYRSRATGEVVETARVLRLGEFAASWESAPRALRLAAVVAELGEVLKGSYWAREADPKVLLAAAQRVSAEYAGDAEVAELAGLVARALSLEAAARPPR